MFAEVLAFAGELLLVTERVCLQAPLLRLFCPRGAGQR